jgi:hypothetical protein
MKRTMIARPTSLGMALATAASTKAGSITTANESNWITRRIIGNLDRDGLGVVHEPAVNAHLSFRTAQKLKEEGII